MHVLVLKIITPNSNYGLSKLATESAHVLLEYSTTFKGLEFEFCLSKFKFFCDILKAH